MPFSVYDGVVAFAKKAKSRLYVGSKTAIFRSPNPEDRIYTVKGRSTRIRQYDAGAAGTYQAGNAGWLQEYGRGTGIQWIDYTAKHDRAKVLSVDAMVEASSYENGMDSSLGLLADDFLNRFMSAEIDAANIAEWYNKIPASNRFGTTAFPIDSQNIMNTLLRIEAQSFNSGFDDTLIVFVSPDVMQALNEYIVSHGGMANSSIVNTNVGIPSVDLPYELDELGEKDGGINIKIDALRIGRMVIIRVPAERMYTNILMFSGIQTDVGQEAGGYAPDLANPNFANIKILAMPLSAAFTDIRYIAENYLVPGSLFGDTLNFTRLQGLNNRLFGNFEIGYAGINQKSNSFEVDFRVYYGGDIFNNRAINCFAVTGPVGAQKKVTGITLTADATTVAVGSTLDVTATIAPADAYNKSLNWYVENGTGQAQVSQSGVVTGIAAGTVTVNAAALDGSQVIGTLQLTVTQQES